MTMAEAGTAADESVDASEDQMTVIEGLASLCDVLVCARDQSRGPCPVP